MNDLLDILDEMMLPAEFYGGPLDGRVEQTIVSPVVLLPYQDGHYLLAEELRDGRHVYRWRES